MATYYLDPVGGNDASAGTSFATRWQSLTSGATAARIAPGDTIRVIQSANATSMGQNATWTDGSRTVTLASAVTAPISPATASWTASTNASSTTSTNRKLGSTSSQLAVSGTFTTGKSHYTTVSQADYSGYQQITFWIMQTSGTLASGDGEISIKLCSDAAGATAVNTFNIPRIKASNQWQAFTIDNGSPLGSSIQSIGFYINNDRNSQTFLINNIQAVKAPSADDSLSLNSLIGKNTGNEGWHAIDSIDGTSVVLATGGPNYNLSAAGTPAGYSGLTETVTTYKREPISLPSSMVAATNLATTWGSVGDSGSAGSPIIFSGGWDSTAMSSQVGDTYISGVNGFGVGISVSTQSYLTFDKVNLFGFYVNLYVRGVCTNINFTAKDVSFGSGYNVSLENLSAGTSGPVNCVITIDNVNSAGSTAGYGVALYRSVKSCVFNIVNLNSNWNYGFQSGTDGNTWNPWIVSNIKANITNVNRNGTNGLYMINLDRSEFNIANVANNGGNQIELLHYVGTTRAPAVNNSKFTVANAITGRGSGFTTYCINLQGGRNNTFSLNGASVSNSAGNGIFTLASIGTKVYGGTFGLHADADFSADGAADLTLINSVTTSTTAHNLWEDASSKIVYQEYDGVADDHRTYFNHGTIMSNAVVRHTASGISWGISPTSTAYVTADFPMVFPLGSIAVAAGSLVTASVWVYRTNTGITSTLVAKGGRIAGVSSDVTATASGSAGAWEQLTVTFTPSEAGTIDLEVQAYGGTTYTVYVDDLDVSQA